MRGSMGWGPLQNAHEILNHVVMQCAVHAVPAICSESGAHEHAGRAGGGQLVPAHAGGIAAALRARPSVDEPVAVPLAHREVPHPEQGHQLRPSGQGERVG